MRPLIHISKVQGHVQIYRDGQLFKNAESGESIKQEDGLSVAPDSSVVLSFADGSKLQVEANTRISLSEDSDTLLQAYSRVRDQELDDSFRLTLVKGRITMEAGDSPPTIYTNLGIVEPRSGKYTVTKQVFGSSGFENLEVTNFGGRANLFAKIAAYSNERITSFIRRDCDASLSPRLQSIPDGATILIQSSRDKNCLIYPIFTPIIEDVIVVSSETPL